MISEAETTADRAIRFVGELTLSDDYLGEPFVLMDWQRDIIRRLFAEDDDGQRIVRECGIWLPRKNGKTQLVSAIACYFLFTQRHSGEIYTAAAEREQAGIIYRMVSGMIRRNPRLRAKCKLIDSQKRILHKTTGTLFCSLSSEAGTKHGFNPSLVIGDEIHVWKNRELWTALTTGSGTRMRHPPLFITITTAGLYSKQSFEWEKWEYASKVADGTFEDPTYLPVIYAADLAENWLDEDVWHRVNPALGTFRSLDEMRLLAEKAQRVPALENDFRRLYLNQHTSQQTRWLQMDLWDRGRRDSLDLEGQPCWCGLDLSTKKDITAFVMIFRQDEGYAFIPHFWIPRDTAVEHEQDDRVPYDMWSKQGFITTTPGSRVDYDWVRSDIVKLGAKYRIQQIAVDPWNAGGIIEDLQRDGFQVLELYQSFRHLNEPARELEALLANGDLLHEGNPCMDWMAGNVEVARTPGGHIRPVKASDTHRVDGVTALVMALSRAMLEEDYRSVYEEEGQLAL